MYPHDENKLAQYYEHVITFKLDEKEETINYVCSQTKISDTLATIVIFQDYLKLPYEVFNEETEEIDTTERLDRENELEKGKTTYDGIEIKLVSQENLGKSRNKLGMQK